MSANACANCTKVAQELHKVHAGCTVSHSSQQLVSPPPEPPGGCNGALGDGDHNHHDAEQISFLYLINETYFHILLEE